MKLKYQIIKVLNNNSILAKQGNDEVILLAKGIAFKRKSMIFLKHQQIPKHF